MEDDLKKNNNGRQPPKNKKWKTTSKKWKTASKKIKKWKTTSNNKMEDEPINQNQPNWL